MKAVGRTGDGEEVGAGEKEGAEEVGLVLGESGESYCRGDHERDGTTRRGRCKGERVYVNGSCAMKWSWRKIVGGVGALRLRQGAARLGFLREMWREQLEERTQFCFDAAKLLSCEQAA